MTERDAIREALLPPPDEGQRRRMVEGVAARIRHEPQDGRPPHPGLAAPRFSRSLRPLLLSSLLAILTLTAVVLLWSARNASAGSGSTGGTGCSPQPAIQTSPPAGAAKSR